MQTQISDIMRAIREENVDGSMIWEIIRAPNEQFQRRFDILIQRLDARIDRLNSGSYVKAGFVLKIRSMIEGVKKNWESNLSEYTRQKRQIDIDEAAFLRPTWEGDINMGHRQLDMNTAKDEDLSFRSSSPSDRPAKKRQPRVKWTREQVRKYETFRFGTCPLPGTLTRTGPKDRSLTEKQQEERLEVMYKAQKTYK